MKLFSRKSLVAAATSAVLISGVLVAPASAQETNTSETSTQESTSEDSSTQETTTKETTEPEVEPEVEQSSSEEFMAGSSDDDGNLKASAIRDWIAVFTAIIGAISTVFVFADKLD